MSAVVIVLSVVLVVFLWALIGDCLDPHPTGKRRIDFLWAIFRVPGGGSQ